MKRGQMFIRQVSYAVSDAAANKGIIKTINGSSSTIKALNGLKVGGRALMVIAIATDAYEIHTSGYEARTIAGVAGGWIGANIGGKLGVSGGGAMDQLSWEQEQLQVP